MADETSGYQQGESQLFSCKFEVKNDDYKKEILIQERDSHLGSGSVKGSWIAGDIANYRKTGSVTIEKRDEDDESLLSGVGFVLKKKNDQGNWLLNLITGNTYSISRTISPKQVEEKVGQKGELVIDGLEWVTVRRG